MEPEVTPNPDTATANVPLSPVQKLKLANLHRKFLDKKLSAEQFAREAQGLETLLQRELAGIATANAIDFTQFALSEDFDIVPLAKK